MPNLRSTIHVCTKKRIFHRESEVHAHAIFLFRWGMVGVSCRFAINTCYSLLLGKFTTNIGKLGCLIPKYHYMTKPTWACTIPNREYSWIRHTFVNFEIGCSETQRWLSFPRRFWLVVQCISYYMYTLKKCTCTELILESWACLVSKLD